MNKHADMDCVLLGRVLDVHEKTFSSNIVECIFMVKKQYKWV